MTAKKTDEMLSAGASLTAFAMFEPMPGVTDEQRKKLVAKKGNRLGLTVKERKDAVRRLEAVGRTRRRAAHDWVSEVVIDGILKVLKNPAWKLRPAGS
jgi:hypothetical protein